MKPPKLGIIAGGGDLPARLVSACRGSARDVFVIGFEGISDASSVESADHAWTRLGTVGRTIELLHAANVEDLVLAGPIKRPSLRAIGLDTRGTKVLTRLLPGVRGDDRLLSLIVRELECEGFRVVGVDDILADLLAPEGPIGTLTPDDDARADISAGVLIARALGTVDVGQAVVVQQGVALGVEAVEGTNALIARCGGLRREGPGGVLVKLSKPGQDRRADLPTVGVQTVECARDAGLKGIAVEAGRSLIVDRSDVAAAADAAALFVVGIDPERA